MDTLETVVVEGGWVDKGTTVWLANIVMMDVKERRQGLTPDARHRRLDGSRPSSKLGGESYPRSNVDPRSPLLSSNDSSRLNFFHKTARR